MIIRFYKLQLSNLRSNDSKKYALFLIIIFNENLKS